MLNSSYYRYQDSRTISDASFKVFQPIGYPIVLRSKKDDRDLACIMINDIKRPMTKPFFTALPNANNRYQMIFGNDSTEMEFILTNLCYEGYIKIDIMKDDRKIVETDPGGLNQVNEVRPLESYSVRADFTNDNRQIIVKKSVKESTGEHVSLKDDESAPKGEKIGGLLYITVTAREGIPDLLEYFKETYWVVPDYVLIKHNAPKPVPAYGGHQFGAQLEGFYGGVEPPQAYNYYNNQHAAVGGAVGGAAAVVAYGDAVGNVAAAAAAFGGKRGAGGEGYFDQFNDEKEKVFKPIGIKTIPGSLKSASFDIKTDSENKEKLMHRNIDAVLSRGERLDKLCYKSDTLSGNSSMFSKKSSSGGFLGSLVKSVSDVFSVKPAEKVVERKEEDEQTFEHVGGLFGNEDEEDDETDDNETDDNEIDDDKVDEIANEKLEEQKTHHVEKPPTDINLINTSHVGKIVHGEKLFFSTGKTYVNYVYDLSSPMITVGMSILDGLAVSVPERLSLVESKEILDKLQDKLEKGILQDVKVFKEGCCVICMEETVNIVLLRCGHQCVCDDECSATLKDKCPVCNSKILRKVRNTQLVIS